MVTSVEPVRAVTLEDQVTFGSPGECCDSAALRTPTATLMATRQPMRVDDNADGNALAKKSRSKTETEERKWRIEKREMGEKPVTISVAVASSSFCHLLCYIVKYL